MTLIEQAPSDLVVVGRVTGLHGIKGWLKLASYTEPRENLLHYHPWYMQFAPGELNDEHPLTIAEGAAQGKSLLARMEGSADRELASRWLGAEIAVRREEFPQLPEGEYYWSQLIGLQVINVEGVGFGVVDYLIDTGANDVLIVRGDRERLIPYVKDSVIKNIDIARGLMRVDWDAEL